MSALATLEELTALRATVAELRESRARMDEGNALLRAEVERLRGEVASLRKVEAAAIPTRAHGEARLSPLIRAAPESAPCIVERLPRARPGHSGVVVTVLCETPAVFVAEWADGPSSPDAGG